MAVRREFFLDAEWEAAALARRELDDFDGLDGRHDEAALLLSEIVAGAFAAGAPRLRVELVLGDDGVLSVTVDTHEFSPGSQAASIAPPATSLRALVGLASSFGVSRRASDASVWFQLEDDSDSDLK